MNEVDREGLITTGKRVVISAKERGTMSDETYSKFCAALEKEVDPSCKTEDMALHESLYALSLVEKFMDTAVSSNGNVLSLDFDMTLEDGEVCIENIVNSVKEIIASLVGLVTNAVSYMGNNVDKNIYIPHDIIVIKETSIKLQKHDYPVSKIIPYLISLNALVQADVGSRAMARICSPSASYMKGQNVFTTEKYMEALEYDAKGRPVVDSDHHFGVVRMLVEKMHARGVKSINRASRFLKYLKGVTNGD